MSSRPPQTLFIEALTRHQPALEAFCRIQLARREDVAEVLQAACVRLWEKSAEWDPAREFLPWAFTVTRFVILSHVRDRMRDRLVLDEDVVQAMASEAEDASVGYARRRERLATCLEKLGSQPRELLSEHYLRGRPLSEMAAATGRTRSALKMQLLRLRAQLAACIDRPEGNAT